MRGAILISSNSGSGHPADEAVLAAAVRLLQRGALGHVLALTDNLEATSRAHADLACIATSELEEALQHARLLLLVGDLSSPAAQQRAARQLLSAQAQRVPVALASVRLRGRCGPGHDDAALRVLGQAESITTCDGPSAALMAGCLGRRVTTTAPLELVLSAKPLRQADAAIALDGDYLEQLPAPERDALLQATSRFCERQQVHATVVCSRLAPTFALPENVDAVAVANWTQWMRRISQVRICVAPQDSVALHLAVAQGAVPLSRAPVGESDLAERIGLGAFAAGMCERSWDELLEAAWHSSIEDVCARSAPLRVVAWRALGSLSEAVRTQPLPIQTDTRLREAVLHILSQAWQERLDRGEFSAVETDLARWPALESSPEWNVARARAWILQGRDAEARALLEATLTATPGAHACVSLLAMILWRAGDVAAAERCWKRLVDAGGEHAAAAQQQRASVQAWRQALAGGNGRDATPTQPLQPPSQSPPIAR